MKRLDMGSSPIKEQRYKNHYYKLERRRQKRINKRLADLEARFPENKYKLEEWVKNNRRGYEIKKYTIRRIK